jgi:hypothetical protein
MANLKISTRLLMSISIPSVLLVAIQIVEVGANISAIGKVWVSYLVAALTPLGWAVWSRVVTTRF